MRVSSTQMFDSRQPQEYCVRLVGCEINYQKREVMSLIFRLVFQNEYVSTPFRMD